MSVVADLPEVPPTLSLESIQEKLVTSVWNTLVVFAVLGAPASASRALYTGWLPAYSVHIFFTGALLIATYFRRRIPRMVRAAMVIVLLGCVSLAGMADIGLLSQASVGFVNCVVLCSLLFQTRTTIVVALLFAAAVTAIAVGFVSGYRQLAFDANVYMLAPLNWGFFLISTLLLATPVALSITVQRKSMTALLAEVERQRDLILHQATHDRLTDLPSLRLATDRLDMALHAATRNQTKVALMFIELDGFKSANDTHGHEAGDVVLKHMASRLVAAVRTTDTVARIGGDEFLVILGDLSEQRLVADTARRIIEAVSVPVAYQTSHISVGCSIGIGLYPDHAADAAALRRAADAAMYTVKRSGKNHFLFAAAPTAPPA